jgi:DNA-binding beta-propeller fold protein YncE
MDDLNYLLQILEHPLVEPIGTTLDGFGNVLVTDTGTNTIQTISIKDRQFIACLKLDTDINCPREITITQPGNYPKLAVASFGNINIIDLRSSDSCGGYSTLPSEETRVSGENHRPVASQ